MRDKNVDAFATDPKLHMLDRLLQLVALERRQSCCRRSTKLSCLAECRLVRKNSSLDQLCAPNVANTTSRTGSTASKARWVQGAPGVLPMRNEYDLFDDAVAVAQADTKRNKLRYGRRRKPLQ
jgi:hypothetical protein